MKLIDANELSLAIDEALKTVSKEVGLSKQLTRILLAEFAHTVLNEAPTVKAIPIEWLERKGMILAANKYDFSAGVIRIVIKEWEKENADTN